MPARWSWELFLSSWPSFVSFKALDFYTFLTSFKAAAHHDAIFAVPPTVVVLLMVVLSCVSCCCRRTRTKGTDIWALNQTDWYERHFSEQLGFAQGVLVGPRGAQPLNNNKEPDSRRRRTQPAAKHTCNRAFRRICIPWSIPACALRSNNSPSKKGDTLDAKCL